MEIFVIFAFLSLPIMGSLLMAARLWGKDRVIHFLSERWYDFGWVADGLCMRLLAAARALIGVAVDRDALRDELIEEVEEMVSHKLSTQLNTLNNKYYDLDCKVRVLEGQPQGDRY